MTSASHNAWAKDGQDHGWTMPPPPPRWARLYRRFFPQHTCPGSRHAGMIATLFRDRQHPIHAAALPYDDPENLAAAIESTVASLWATRRDLAAAEKLLAELGYTRSKRQGPARWRRL